MKFKLNKLCKAGFLGIWLSIALAISSLGAGMDNNEAASGNGAAATAGAMPVISGLSGNIIHNQSVTISGSGFGTKATAAPLEWDNFEWGSNGDLVAASGRGWSQANYPSPPDVAINTIQKYGQGTRSAYYYVDPPEGQQAPEEQEFGYLQKSFGEQQKVYASYMIRNSRTIGTYAGMWKLARLCNWSKEHRYNSHPTMGVTELLAVQWDLFYSTGSGISENYFNKVIDVDAWHRVEYYYVVSPTAGEVKAWLNTKPYFVTAPNTGDGSELPDSFISPHMWVNAEGGFYEMWLDDVYIDNTQARVELCDAATWTARSHCEIQIPTAWSDNSITVTVNQGSFTDGQTAYLYVIDENGNVNANGYPIIIGTSEPPNELKAFPEAEGFGAYSKGGRGGQVIKVTNLNDSGPGSFREAVTTPGARIIVFNVSGIINLQTNLNIYNPYITIAGQTSPGGILIAGRPILINTNDVIIQHMRFRMGTHKVIDSTDAETMDTFQIFGNNIPSWYPNPAFNIIVDHCSFSWSIDEILDMGEGADNVTLSWSTFAEPLDCTGTRVDKPCHSKAVLVSGKFCTAPQICANVSFHHNYIVHSADRNPVIGAGGAAYTGTPPFMDAVNNVIYNFDGALSMNTQYKATVNWVHNYIKPGPNSNAPDPVGNAFEVIHIIDGGPTEPMIYVSGNIGVTRASQSALEWETVGKGWSGDNLNVAFRQTTPWPAPPITTTTMSYDYALQILNDVGATKPIRDSVDTRVINDFSAGTGRIIDNVVYPDDFPTFQNLPAPADIDNDGMSDAWEISQGLNVGADDSALDKDGDGYTNIEEYLYYLSAPIVPNPPGDLNGDGKVSIADIQLCIKVILGTETNDAIVQKAKELAAPYDAATIKDIQEIIKIILSP